MLVSPSAIFEAARCYESEGISNMWDHDSMDWTPEPLDPMYWVPTDEALHQQILQQMKGGHLDLGEPVLDALWNNLMEIEASQRSFPVAPVQQEPIGPHPSEWSGHYERPVEMGIECEAGQVAAHGHGWPIASHGISMGNTDQVQGGFSAAQPVPQTSVQGSGLFAPVANPFATGVNNPPSKSNRSTSTRPRRPAPVQGPSRTCKFGPPFATFLTFADPFADISVAGSY